MNKKRYLIIGIVALSVLLISGVTYAWYTWSTSSENETKIVTNLGAATVYYESGSNITADIMPVSSKEEGIIKEITVKTDKNTTYKLSFNLYLDILDLPDIFKHESFKYAIYKDSVLVKEGNFTETFETCTLNSTSHIVLINNESITTTTSTYTLYLWIDGENYTNPSEMQNKNIRLKLHADGQNAILGDLGETVTQYITRLYEEADKTTVTNNDITYNYASSVSLMNDRLGGTTSDYNAGNIRYYGASPNNYISLDNFYEEDVIINNWEAIGFPFTESSECYAFFECSNLVSQGVFEDEASCIAGLPEVLEQEFGVSSVDDICGTTIFTKGTAKEPKPDYRIIGLFKDVEVADGSKQNLIKVVRANLIENYSWDTSGSTVNNGWGINEWSQADLMKLLNPGYESETVGGSLWWNSGSGTCYNNQSNATISCDFKNTGLSSNVQNKIASVVWNTGGWYSSSVYSNQIYAYERGTKVISNPSDGVTRTTTWTGKVALMYPSDYGYAADYNNCSGTLDGYDTDGCYNNDWLYSGGSYWLLTPTSNLSSTAWVLTGGGLETNHYLGNTHNFLPVFYLNSELVIMSGDGSESNPYVVR